MSTIKTDETLETTTPETAIDAAPADAVQETAAGDPVTAADIAEAGSETTDAEPAADTPAEPMVTASDLAVQPEAEKADAETTDNPFAEASDSETVTGPTLDVAEEPAHSANALVPIEDPAKEDGPDAAAADAEPAGPAQPSFFARAIDRVPTNGLLLLSAIIVWTAVYISYIR